MEDSTLKKYAAKEQIEVGNHVEIGGILWRVVYVRSNGRAMTLESVARIKQEASA